MSRITVVAVLAVLLLAACEQQEPSITLEEQVPAEMREEAEPAENNDEAPADAAETVEFQADELFFEGIPETLAAGAVEFVMENVGNLPHDLVIEELGDRVVVPLTDAGETNSGTVELESGEYTLYCDVPGHRAGGMEETVTVE
jgi:plastocyanin